MNKQPHGTQKMLPCPRCGELPGGCTCKSKAVKATTVKALVTEEALTRVGMTEGFRFCFETDCDIVYFNPETGDRYLRQDVRVRVGQKETRLPRTVCYCFNHTVEDIEADVAKTGTSGIPDEITKQCREGLDRCEVTNPQGSCCLGNVKKALTEARAKFGAVPTGTDDKESSCCCEPQKTADSNKKQTSSGRAGLAATGGSVVSAVVASACCWLPLLLIAFGLSAGGIASWFTKWRPLFLVAAAVLLGLGFYLIYLKKPACEPGSACAAAKPKGLRFNRVMFWVAAAAVVGFSLFPNYAGYLIGGNAASPINVDAASTTTVTLPIEGMTCEACAANIQNQLAKVPGVTGASVSYSDSRAVVETDAFSPPATASLIEAVERAGFKVNGEIKQP